MNECFTFLISKTFSCLIFSASAACWAYSKCFNKKILFGKSKQTQVQTFLKKFLVNFSLKITSPSPNLTNLLSLFSLKTPHSTSKNYTPLPSPIL